LVIAAHAKRGDTNRTEVDSNTVSRNAEHLFES